MENVSSAIFDDALLIIITANYVTEDEEGVTQDTDYFVRFSSFKESNVFKGSNVFNAFKEKEKRFFRQYKPYLKNPTDRILDHWLIIHWIGKDMTGSALLNYKTNEFDLPDVARYVKNMIEES